jgi:FHS family L-fucose permease-like MFS transporter
LFWFARLPEIDEASLTDTLSNQDDVKPLHKQWHTIFGVFAQFSYVGAQVSYAATVSVWYSPGIRSQWQRLQ